MAAPLLPRAPAPEATSVAVPPPTDLRITIWRDEAILVGTRAQIEASGARATTWPASSASAARWTAAGLDYALRPLTNGLWRLRTAPADELRTQFLLDREERELQADLHRHSAAGRAERRALWRAWCAARADAAFKQFIAKVQGGCHA